MEKKYEKSNHAGITCLNPCPEHALQDKRVEILENKLSVVEENTRTVNKLSTKVSLLLTIMSFIIVIVTAGATYTFTGLNAFKDIYAEDRIELQTKISKMQMEDREFIRKELKDMENTLENRVDILTNKVIILESKVISRN